VSWELPEGTFTYWHAAIAGLVTVKTAPDIRALASAGPGISVSGTYSVTDFGATTCVPVDSSSFMFRCDTTGLVRQYSGDLSGTAVADFTSLINRKTRPGNRPWH
jgi:hypothetical protein